MSSRIASTIGSPAPSTQVDSMSADVDGLRRAVEPPPSSRHVGEVLTLAIAGDPPAPAATARVSKTSRASPAHSRRRASQARRSSAPHPCVTRPSFPRLTVRPEDARLIWAQVPASARGGSVAYRPAPPVPASGRWNGPHWRGRVKSSPNAEASPSLLDAGCSVAADEREERHDQHRQYRQVVDQIARELGRLDGQLLRRSAWSRSQNKPLAARLRSRRASAEDDQHE